MEFLFTVFSPSKKNQKVLNNKSASQSQKESDFGNTQLKKER